MPSLPSRFPSESPLIDRRRVAGVDAGGAGAAGSRLCALPVTVPGMTVWQYAQMRVTYDNRLAAGHSRWTVAWHGPDGAHDMAGAYEDVVTELNRVGTESWELVDVAAMDAGDSGRFPDQRDWSLTRYARATVQG